MKDITLKAFDFPETPRFGQAVLNLISQREKVSYKMIKEELQTLNEMRIRRALEELVFSGYVEKERCLCGKGFVWKLHPNYLKLPSKVKKKR